LRRGDGSVPNERARVAAWVSDGSALAITRDDDTTWLIDTATFSLVRRVEDRMLALAAGHAFTRCSETGAVNFTTTNELVWSQRRRGWQIAGVPVHPHLSLV